MENLRETPAGKALQVLPRFLQELVILCSIHDNVILERDIDFHFKQVINRDDTLFLESYGWCVAETLEEIEYHIARKITSSLQAIQGLIQEFKYPTDFEEGDQLYFRIKNDDTCYYHHLIKLREILMNRYSEQFRVVYSDYVGDPDLDTDFVTAQVDKHYDFVNPSHYKDLFSKEVIDMMIDIWGKEKVSIYCEINAFKYKMRLGEKPDQPVERDLEKARWYLNKAKELRKE